MKKLILIALLCLFPLTPSLAHPGKTDRQGGHKCLKDCEEWKLYYMEYHLHDKDGRPIHVERRRKKPAVAPAVPSQVAQTDVLPVSATTNTVTVYRTVTVEEEDLLLSNPLLYLLLLLLVLLLVVRMNRQRDER